MALIFSSMLDLASSNFNFISFMMYLVLLTDCITPVVELINREWQRMIRNLDKMLMCCNILVSCVV